MWQIESLNINTTPVRQAYFVNGNPITAQQTGTARLMVNSLGFVDFVLSSTNNLSVLILNGHSTDGFLGNATIQLAIDNNKLYTAKINAAFSDGSGSKTYHGQLTNVEGFTSEDIAVFQQMISQGLIPYHNIPAPGAPKSGNEIQALADKYFPGDPNGFEMAYSIYDWTTSNFLRFLLFTEMVYNQVEGTPVDLESIQQMIWDHYYPPSYWAESPDFMAMFGLKAAQNELSVASQLTNPIATNLQYYVNAEFRIFKQAVLELPKISTAQYPKLYRGAMPLNVRQGAPSTADRFGPSFWEYEGNSGPTSQRLQLPLEDAVQQIFQVGSYVTPKACWSFTDTFEDAVNYQNGIVITASPPPGYAYWPSGANILPFSVNVGATEFNFPMKNRYRVDNVNWIDIKGQTLLSLELTMFGTFD